MSSAERQPLKYLVLIPAYNEEATIKALLEAVIQQQPDHIVVVNDASNDRTAEILVSYADYPEITILHNASNLGKAGSLWCGFDRAMEYQVDVVITMDGDGQHRAEDILLLLNKYQEYPGSLIIGARQRDLSTQPLGRFLANRFANFWISWAAGYGVPDSQSGFRLYPVSLLRKIEGLRESDGFVFESEVIIEAAWQHVYVKTVAIPVIYHKNRRPSHFKPWQDIKKITKMVAGRLKKRNFSLFDLYAALAQKTPAETLKD